MDKVIENFFYKKRFIKGIFFTFADNFLAAIDTAKIALAPNFVFCLVPSKLIKIHLFFLDYEYFYF